MTDVTAQELGAKLHALELFANSLEGGIVLLVVGNALRVVGKKKG